MADVNVNAPVEQAPAMAPPTRTDEQILPHSSWVPVGKSNCYLDVEQSQSNPIYKIAVDILKHTNFFRAFTASSKISSIYIQQFWDTVRYITPVDNNHSFSSAPKLDVLINFINDLGYPKVVRTLSAVVTNDMHQPWRALTTIINLCLTGKTLGFERPRSPFSAKGNKREVFGMPILNELITDDIRGGQYYNEYLEKVTKHQRYLADEEGSDPGFPAPKPTKATKPKATKQSMPSVPKAAPEKKRRLVKETSDEQSPAKRSKPGLVTKKCKPTSSLRLVDEFIDEGVPENKPRLDDEEANLQRAVEESLKDVHATHRGPLPPMVFREPDFRRRQPHPEVQGKGKGEVTKEQVVHSLFDLNTPKKKSTTDQYILQRRKPKTIDPTGPSTHHEDEKATRADVETNTEELLTHTEKSGEEISNTVVLGTESGGQDEKQGGPDPDEGFTATSYPNVQENLKLTVEEQEILEEPASSIRTLSSLQHLTKDFSFGDQFFNDKPSEAKNEKTTTETEAESMVSITIQQDTSTIPPMTTPNRFRDFPEVDMKEILHQRIWETNSYQTNEDHNNLYEALEKSMARDQTNQFLTDLAEARRKNKRRYDLPKTSPGSPPHQPPPTPPPAAWTTSDTRFKPSLSLIPKDLHMDDDSAPNERVHSSDDEDIRNDHIPKVNLMQDWWKPLSEEDRPATPKPVWSIPSSWHLLLHPHMHLYQRTRYWLRPYQMEECHKLLTNKVDDELIRYNVSKPLPLGGQPGQIIIQTDFFFNKDLGYLRFGSKGSRLALSISKMKSAYYPDVGVEQMVPDQMWIEEECKDKYRVQMIMRFNEIHKFSDGTLHQIDKALDYRVKECKVNRMNLGFNTRFWTRKDVDRSKEFMFSIQKRLKTRRIFRNLESFIGGTEIKHHMARSSMELKIAKLLSFTLYASRFLGPPVMSSLNHPTSNIEDASFSNFSNYIPASSVYVPASLGKTYSSSSKNSFGLVSIASPTLSLFHDDPYMKVMHAYYAKESHIPPPVIMHPSPMPSPMFNSQEFFLPNTYLQDSLMVAATGKIHVNSQPHAYTSYS
nr:hypothetical protein [Tanacetum cinerariifolium]